jgi:S1-C subfamily serine protease
LLKRDTDPPFIPAKFTNKARVGDHAYIIGKSTQDINLVESGIINETTFNPKSIFGNDHDTPAFNIMVNIPNQHHSLYGGPLFDEENNVLGMVFPF